MYESPITVIQDNVQPIIEKTIRKNYNALDEQIVYKCQQVLGIEINKEEIEKALRYDRGQYDKGYADGKNSAFVYGHWKAEEDEYRICATIFTCSVCDETFCSSELTDDEFYEMMNYCPHCGAKMDEKNNE